MPQNNSIIERTNQDVKYGTRALLAQAGLPACLWVYAAPCYCMLDNVCTVDSEGKSAWEKGTFDGLRIPFGCKVTYYPSPTKGVDPGTWNMPTRTGVFAGYVMKPGMKWSKK